MRFKAKMKVDELTDEIELEIKAENIEDLKRKLKAIQGILKFGSDLLEKLVKLSSNPMYITFLKNFKV